VQKGSYGALEVIFLQLVEPRCEERPQGEDECL
jgi:hypothetical protein